MAIQILAAKMLTPYFGTSLYIWGTVIGVTLISLSLGYYTGGITADRFYHRNTLLWVMLLASVFILSMPYVARSLLFAFVDSDIITSIIAISLILIVPPLSLMGMIPTLLIRLISKKAEDSGRITGTIFTISTIGGILSVLLTGFYIIPNFGISIPTVIIGLISGSISFLLLLTRGNIIVLMYFAVVAFSFHSLKEKKTHSGINVLYSSEGLLGQIMVADFNDTERYLFLNRIGQTGVNLHTGKSISSYVNYLKSLASILPENSDVLLLGLGGGSVVNELQPSLKINFDAVELDERIVHTAQEFFALNDNTNIIIDDARHYIERTEKTYDLIIFDVFKGEIPPDHVLSIECFQKAISILNPEGFLIVNFNGFITDDIGKTGRALYKTLTAADLEVRVLSTFEQEVKYRNNLFIAMTNLKSFSNVPAPLILNGVATEVETLFIDFDKIDLSDVEVLRDDKSLLQHYNIDAASIWRAEYNRHFAKRFDESGIPIFD